MLPVHCGPAASVQCVTFYHKDFALRRNDELTSVPVILSVIPSKAGIQAGEAPATRQRPLRLHASTNKSINSIPSGAYVAPAESNNQESLQ
jgi:hypothetical protein